jgi:hypothetical protein
MFHFFPLAAKICPFSGKCQEKNALRAKYIHKNYFFKAASFKKPRRAGRRGTPFQVLGVYGVIVLGSGAMMRQR